MANLFVVLRQSNGHDTNEKDRECAVAVTTNVIALNGEKGSLLTCCERKKERVQESNFFSGSRETKKSCSSFES
jgi:hypothetical protein